MALVFQGGGALGAYQAEFEPWGNAAPQDSNRGHFSWAWRLTNVEKVDVPVLAAWAGGLLEVDGATV